MKRQILRNQKGMTVLEVMIASGMGVVVLFGVLTLHSSMMRTQVSSTNTLEVVDMRYEISGLLAKVDTCTGLLAGRASAAGVDLNLSTNIRAGGNYGNLQFTSIRLQNIVDLGNYKRKANIQILGTRRGKNIATSSVSELINVYYIVNASNVIVTCRDNANVCTSMGGVWRTDHCDFCANLGGVLQPNGSCAKAGP